VRVALPPPPPRQVTTLLTVIPVLSPILSTTPLGTTVATVSVANSDGSVFAGMIFFTSPNFDAGGVFALQGHNIILNPLGPGIANITGTVTDHITLDATP
jgi:hypothetical protein